jgi:hypothetical protein
MHMPLKLSEGAHYRIAIIPFVSQLAGWALDRSFFQLMQSRTARFLGDRSWRFAAPRIGQLAVHSGGARAGATAQTWLEDACDG